MFSRMFIQYKTKRAGIKNMLFRKNISFGMAKKIGVLFTIEDVGKHNAAKKFINELKSENKEIEILAFLPKGRDNHEFLYNFFTKKDYSYFGKLNNDHALEFINTPFDLLFCLDFSANIFIQNILALSKAKCRVGNYSVTHQSQLELLVKPRAQKFELLNSDLLHYAKTFA